MASAGKTSSEGTVAVRRARRSPAEIRRRLLDAAHDVFTESGFSGATTAAIAARAEVTEAQLFRYYPTKADLFRAAVFEPLNRHFREFMSRHDGSARPQGPGALRSEAEEYITELQHFAEHNARMLLSLVAARAFGATPPSGREAVPGLSDYFEAGAQLMSRRPPEALRVRPDLMVRVSFAAVLGCVLFDDWIFPPGLATPEEISAAINVFVLDGVNANTDPAMQAGRPTPERSPS